MAAGESVLVMGNEVVRRLAVSSSVWLGFGRAICGQSTMETLRSIQEFLRRAEKRWQKSLSTPRTPKPLQAV